MSLALCLCKPLCSVRVLTVIVDLSGFEFGIYRREEGERRSDVKRDE